MNDNNLARAGKCGEIRIFHVASRDQEGKRVIQLLDGGHDFREIPDLSSTPVDMSP